MTDLVKLTPEQAAEVAKQYANRDSILVPHEGMSIFDNYIYAESDPVVYDVLHAPGNQIIPTIQGIIDGTKNRLRHYFRHSRHAATHKEAGFVFVIHTCVKNGNPTFDLSTNQPTDAVGIFVKARYYAVKK